MSAFGRALGRGLDMAIGLELLSGADVTCSRAASPALPPPQELQPLRVPPVCRGLVDEDTLQTAAPPPILPWEEGS